jgi:hypothetical protein
MTWLALGGAASLQLLAGVLRVPAWFHVIRHSCPDASDLRYRDVALAHLGGVGWNAVLPAHAGDAIKVVLLRRRMPERRLATLALTLVPPALVEAAFTALLLAGLLGAGLVSLRVLSPILPRAGTALVIAVAVCVGVLAALVFRRRLKQLVRDVRSGLAVLGRPRIMATRIVPWLAAGRGVRLLAFAVVLTAAGVPFGLGPALALMALQGVTPSAGVAVTAARTVLLAAALSGTGAADVPPARVAEPLAAAYGVTSVVNLAVSAAVIAWLLRTGSPRRIIGYARSALRTVKREPGGPWPLPLPVDATTSSGISGGQAPSTPAGSLGGGPGLGRSAQ